MLHTVRPRTPFRVRGGNIFAQARLGNQTYLSLVDTGSDRVVLSNRVGRKFRTIRQRHMKGIVGTVPVNEVRLPPIHFLGKTFPKLAAVVRPPLADDHSQLTVILGTNVLLSRPLTIDVEYRSLGVHSRRGGPVFERRSALLFHHGRPYLRATFGGRRVLALLDTGAPLCELDTRVKGIHSRTTREEPMTDGSGAPVVQQVFQGPELRVGDWSLGAPEFWRSPLNRSNLWPGRHPDFVLGANVLLRTGGSWTFDRQRAWVGWRSPSRYMGPEADGSRMNAGLRGESVL